MKSITLAIVATTLAAASVPALAAKADCDAGYKTFLGKMSKMVEGTGGDALAEAIRKSLTAYDACKAGDDFSPHGVWDQIVADMSKASR